VASVPMQPFLVTDDLKKDLGKVGDYDEKAKSVALTLAGYSEPVSLPVASADAAKSLQTAVLPYLKLQMVLSYPTSAVKVGQTPKPVVMAQRIYNRCTGEVLESQPASHAKPTLDAQGCPAGGPQPVASTASNLPMQLSMSQIQAGMQGARAAVSACYDQYGVDGEVDVTATIAGTSGKVTSVKIAGPLKGTPSAGCVSTAVQKLSFPRFQSDAQDVTLPFFLR
jgi:hypothetical protein